MGIAALNPSYGFICVVGPALMQHYRIYFGRDGEKIIVLLTGGTKKRQRRDIDAAHAYWQDYKRGKRGRG
jgi:hypothetical protein